MTLTRQFAIGAVFLITALAGQPALEVASAPVRAFCHHGHR